MDVRILGPLEVWVDGRRVELGRGRQRMLLAILALHANQVVSSDRLIDELWGENPPQTAHKALQNAVSQLRSAIAPAGNEVLLTQSPGYVLELVPDALDTSRFERLAAEGRHELEENPGRAAELLQEALTLWRGEPLSDFTYERFAQEEIARLDELRLAATEDRIDADLSLGRHAEVLPELEMLVSSHPLDERLRGQLMLALYRSGRQAEALETCRLGRSALREELGLEPGAALKQLEHAILTQDPALGPSPKLPAPPRTRRRRLVLGAAAGLLAVAAAALAIVLLLRDEGTPVVVPNSLVKIDPRTNEIVDVIPVGRNPGTVAAVSGYVFTASIDEGTLYRVDMVTGEVTASGRYDASGYGDVAGEGDSWLWVASTNQARVVRAHPESLEWFDEVRLPPLTSAWIAVGGGSLWVSEYLPPAVSRWSLRTLQLERRYRLRADSVPFAVRFGDGDAWVADYGRDQLLRIDARSGRPSRIAVGRDPLTPRTGYGSVWLQMATDNTVWRIDPGTGVPRAIIPVPTLPADLDTGANAIWVTSIGAGVVSRIDPETNSVVATIRTGYYPVGIAVGGGFVWVGVGEEPPRGP